MTDSDPMLVKVRKLLTKAEDPAATTEEAELYTAKAAALIAAYGIDEALLAHEDPARDPVVNAVVTLEAPYAADKASLLAVIANRLRCRTVLLGRHGAERRVHLFGHATDLRRAEVLFTSLLVQAHTGLVRTPVPSYDHPAAFRRSWLAGFSQAIGARLHEAEQVAERAAAERFSDCGTTTAVVLADRETEVGAALETAYPHTTTARPRLLSGRGRGAGYAAGQRADLGGTRFTGRRRALPGA